MFLNIKIVIRKKKFTVTVRSDAGRQRRTGQNWRPIYKTYSRHMWNPIPFGASPLRGPSIHHHNTRIIGVINSRILELK